MQEIARYTDVNYNTIIMLYDSNESTMFILNSGSQTYRAISPWEWDTTDELNDIESIEYFSDDVLDGWCCDFRQLILDNSPGDTDVQTYWAYLKLLEYKGVI